MKTHPPKIASLKFATLCSEIATLSYRSAPVKIESRDHDHGSWEWIHMVPLTDIHSLETVPVLGSEGETREAVVKTVFNTESARAMMKNFEPGRLLDFEHSDQSDDPANSTEAAGWIEELRFVKDGLDARVDWSSVGEAKIRGKAYRFVSPVVTGTWDKLDAEGTVEDPVLFYPTELEEAGLTNRPKMAGKLRAFFKEAKKESPDQSRSANPRKEMKYKATLAAILGVDENIADDQLATKAKDFTGELATLRNKAGKLDEVQAKVTALESERLDQDLARFKDVITDKESAKALFKADRGAALKTFEGLASAEGDDQAPHGRIHNKGQIVNPDKQAAGQADKSAKIANLAAKLASEKGLSLSEAQKQAVAEIG